MSEYKDCYIKNGNTEGGFSICEKLSVVDDTKTDMEYDCFSCNFK